MVRRWTDDAVRDALREWLGDGGDGTQASYNAWRDEHPDAPPISAIVYRRGTWRSLTTGALFGEDTPTKPQPDPGPPPRHRNADAIVRLYGEGLTMLEVGRRLGHNEATVLRVLREEGVPRRPRGGTDRAIDGDRAAQLYATGLSIAAVARTMGHDPRPVRKALDERGIPRHRAQADSEVVALYRSGLSAQKVSDRTGHSVASVYRNLRRAGVERRPRAQ